MPDDVETFGLDEEAGAVTGEDTRRRGTAESTEQHDCSEATLSHERMGTQNSDDRGNTMVRTGSVTQGGGGVALAFTFGGVSV